MITALGKTWHKEHFTCAHCQSELGNKNFFEREGRPYCEPDYHSLFSPRCAYCNGPILDVSGRRATTRDTGRRWTLLDVPGCYRAVDTTWRC